jgi:AcrR family transcriptional regulator
MGAMSPSAPQVGRPRCEESRARILAATNALLETTSWSALAVETIAARAKVGKQTIYKWWGGKSALVMEAALTNLEVQVFADDTGDARRDVLSFLKRSSKTLRDTATGRTLAALIAEAQNDATFARAFREQFQNVRREALRSVLQRGITRGEIIEDLDVELFIDTVFGAFWYRLLSNRAPINEKFAEQLVGMLWPSLRAKGRG